MFFLLWEKFTPATRLLLGYRDPAGGSVCSWPPETGQKGVYMRRLSKNAQGPGSIMAGCILIGFVKCACRML